MKKGKSARRYSRSRWFVSSRPARLGHRHRCDAPQLAFEQLEPRMFLDAALPTLAWAATAKASLNDAPGAAVAGLDAALTSAITTKGHIKPPPGGGYHTYDTLLSDLRNIAATHPNIAQLIDISTYTTSTSTATLLTKGGRHLWAMKISDNAIVAEAGEPELAYIGSMHGNEPVGMEMCYDFIKELTDKYGTDSSVTSLVNGNEIWVLPLMNPDGLQANKRENGWNQDLNRSFPHLEADSTQSTNQLGPAFTDADLQGLNKGRTPEAAAVMRWSRAENIVLAANFHTGNLVVNYPYDSMAGVPSGQPAISPDDALFRYISTEYASHNAPMFASTQFPGGITNGNQWYQVIGGMQDWSYRYLGTNEVTVELSSVYKPPASQLPTLWNNNRDSMMAYLETIDTGIRGLVTDSGGHPLRATVTVVDMSSGTPVANAHKVFTSQDFGDYYRMLLPGSYNIAFSCPGYAAQTINGVSVSLDMATLVNVTLPAALGGRSVVNVGNSPPQNQNVALAAAALRGQSVWAPAAKAGLDQPEKATDAFLAALAEQRA